MNQRVNATTFEVPDGYPKRLLVPDNEVDWSVPAPGYAPEYYTSDHVLDKAVTGEAEPEVANVYAHMVQSVCELQRDEQGRPLNPNGRTGVAGRGLLYFWGPNHTADIILTRQGSEGLEIVIGRRSDNGKLALPGGFLNIGEIAIQAALRELWEETKIDLRSADPAYLLVGRYLVQKSIRMTDHAWIETTVFHIDADVVGVSDTTPVGSDDMLPGTVKWRAVNGLDLDKLHDDHGRYIRDYLALAATV